MRLDLVFFSGRNFSFGRICAAKNWDPLQSANLHCTVIVSIHRPTSCICKIINSNLGGIFRSESLGLRISTMGLVGQAGATSKGFRSKTKPKADVNSEERPVSHFAAWKKCTLTNGRVWKTWNGMHIENEVIRLMKRVVVGPHAPSAVNISVSATVKADQPWHGSPPAAVSGGKWRTIEDFEMRRRCVCVSIVLAWWRCWRLEQWLAGAAAAYF